MTDADGLPTLSQLVEQHAALLYRYAYRLCGRAVDAEDLTQQTFLVAQERREQLRSADTARGWLCTILRNLYLKSRRHGELQPLEVEPADGREPGQPEGDIDPEELQAALQELPETFRTPLILFYFEEFSYQEIAGQLGVPIGTVMSRLARGKAHLKQRLGRREEQTHVRRLTSAGVG